MVSASMAFASDCVIAGEPVVHVGCDVVSERGVVAVVDTPASTRPPRIAVQRHRLCDSIASATRTPGPETLTGPWTHVHACHVERMADELGCRRLPEAEGPNSSLRPRNMSDGSTHRC